ncbi:hypothetical protein [Orrella sp. 11846]|uniref:hypothetical protein n=1 Tax=Orrella sp. 11846 TaxID=3409913 RepID=UPI003B5964B6
MFLHVDENAFRQIKRHWHLKWWLLLMPWIGLSPAYAIEHDMQRLSFDRELALEISRTCEASDFANLLRHGGLVPCLQAKTAAAVGHLCVTFQVFCLDRPWGAWLTQFLSAQTDLTDVMFDETGVSLLGGSQAESWQIQNWPPGSQIVPKAVILSTMRHYRQNLQSGLAQINDEEGRAQIEDLLFEVDREITKMENHGPETFKTPLGELSQGFSAMTQLLDDWDLFSTDK